MDKLNPPEARKPTTLFGYPIVIKIAAQEIPLPLRKESLMQGRGEIDVEAVLEIIQRFQESGVE